MSNQNINKDLIFIGDLHGQYKKLTQLLAKLNFDINDSESAIRQYQLVFVGDLIDNKPALKTEQLKTLTFVKQLIDEGFAHCIMGNHELNAVGWATKNRAGTDGARPHTENNRKQHAAFLIAVGEGSKQHQHWVDWFKSLPLYLDFGDIRAIHACWDGKEMEALQPYLTEDNQLQDQYWIDVFDKQKPLYNITETLLKGPELALPDGVCFHDKTGTRRTNIRVRWWLDEATTYQEIAQVQESERGNIPDTKLPSEFTQRFNHNHFKCEPTLADTTKVPMVIGHYTLNGEPTLLSEHVVCVDYNAANEKADLVGFVYHRETSLSDDGNGFVSSELKYID